MTRSAGRWIALLLLVFAAGMVIHGVRTWRAAPAPKSTVASATDFGPPPTSARTVDPASGSTQDLVATAGEGVWTRVDPNTGRLLLRFTWARLDPLESGEIDVQSPRLWIFEDNGSVRVAAPRGRIVWPSREQAPESGRLDGGVELTLHERDASEEHRGTPRLTARTPSLSFHRPAREVAADGNVEVEGSGVRASAAGLTLRYDPDSSPRILLLRFERDGRFEYTPAASRHAEAETSESTEQTAAADTVVYRVRLEGDVSVSTGDHALAGERLTLFARTVRGRLRDGAVADAPTAAQAPPSSGPPRLGDTVVVTWTGPMELRPTRDSPDVLAENDAFACLDSPLAGRVEYRADAGETRVEAGAFEYAATTRRLNALAGDEGVLAWLPGGAHARLGDVRINLNDRRGTVAGPGEIRLDHGGALAGTARAASWSERAEFAFDESGSAVIPTQARIFGGASIRDGESSVRGEMIRADFAPPDAGASPRDVAVRRLAIVGDARAGDSHGGSASGDAIDVAFGTDDMGRSVPTFAAVRGVARASRDGESLAAELIEASLTRSAEGGAVVSRVEARGGVVAELSRADASDPAAAPRLITVRADVLRADPTLRAVELIGAPAEISQRSDHDAGAVRGGSMRIDAADDFRRLTVFGPGSATHESTRHPGDGGRSIRANIEWTGGMVYDDLGGRADAEGGVLGRLAVDTNENHEVRGRSITIDITPAADARSTARRSLLRARVEGEDDAPAEVELRRYLPDAEPRRLEGLAFLRGPSIELTHETNHLSVDGPGVLLIEDRRPVERNTGVGDAGLAFAGRRGTTLFSWRERMSIDRPSGLGEMFGDVTIRHRDAASGLFTEVTSDRAVAHLVETPSADGAADAGLRLVRAEALGGVAARHRALVIQGDRLEYDASTERFRVSADAPARATLHDGDSGRTIDCAAASVDLATGTYRVERIHAGSTPR